MPLTEQTALAGFSKVDITPPLGQMEVFGLGYWYERRVRFSGVRDPLFARTLVLGDGAACQVILSVDAIFDSFGLTADAETRISKALKIPRANVFITCTHTHSAPLIGINNTDCGSEYGRLVADHIVAGAGEASARREPMSISVSRRSISGVARNRRPLLRDGRIAELHAPLDPDEVIDWGPVDDRMTVVKYRRPSGRLAGALCHFGIHNVAVQCSDLFRAAPVRRV